MAVFSSSRYPLLFLPDGSKIYQRTSRLLSKAPGRHIACLVILHVFLSSAVFFHIHVFQKKSFRNTIRVSYSLDPDQA